MSFAPIRATAAFLASFFIANGFGFVVVAGTGRACFAAYAARSAASAACFFPHLHWAQETHKHFHTFFGCKGQRKEALLTCVVAAHAAHVLAAPAALASARLRFNSSAVAFFTSISAWYSRRRLLAASSSRPTLLYHAAFCAASLGFMPHTHALRLSHGHAARFAASSAARLPHPHELHRSHKHLSAFFLFSGHAPDAFVACVEPARLAHLVRLILLFFHSLPFLFPSRHELILCPRRPHRVFAVGVKRQ